jgi:transmembrane sensor
MSQLSALGRHIARLQDEARVQSGTAEAARRSFIRSLRRRAVTPKSFLLVAGFIGTLGLSLAFFFVRHHPITVTVGGAVPAVNLGAAVSAPADREVPLSFSDGSTIALAPGSEAAIAALDHNGGTLGIRHGRAHVQIEHRANTHWVLRAGPYTVSVTGTRFDIEWQPETERFWVRMLRGSVVVSGNPGNSPAILTAGQELLVSRGAWSVRDSQLAEAIAPTIPSPVGVTEETLANLPQKAAVSSGTPAVASAPNTVAPKGWAQLAGRGDYRGAYEAAEREGLEAIVRHCSSGQLLRLAEVARFAGHAEQGQNALQVLRSRFPGSHDAALAAFLLGRLVGGGQAAVYWFRTYLQEQAGGELAREASGRLLEALWQAGDRQSARAQAQQYLRSYPQGPHAAFARRLIEQPSQ